MDLPGLAADAIAPDPAALGRHVIPPLESLLTPAPAGPEDPDTSPVQGSTRNQALAAFDFTGVDPQTVLYDSALALLERWSLVPRHQSMELGFAAGDARLPSVLIHCHPMPMRTLPVRSLRVGSFQHQPSNQIEPR